MGVSFWKKLGHLQIGDHQEPPSGIVPTVSIETAPVQCHDERDPIPMIELKRGNHVTMWQRIFVKEVQSSFGKMSTKYNRRFFLLNKTVLV